MRIQSLAGLATVLLIGACGSPTTSPASSPSSAPATSSPASAASPSRSAVPVVGRDLRVGIVGADVNISSTLLASTIFSSIVRLDERLEPVPELATEPCLVSEAGKTYTCHLHQARFHDGTPLTADDVVFTFRLAQRPPCAIGGGCPDILSAVTAVDPSTVRFELTRGYAPFLSKYLTSPILPRKAVEASFARFEARAKAVDPAKVKSQVEAIDAELNKARPDCTALISSAAALLAEAGVSSPDRLRFTSFGGNFDACGYLAPLDERLSALASAREATGSDALAAALEIIDFADEPIGSGPWRWARIEGRDVVLEADPGYFGGPPASPRFVYRLFPDGDLSAVVEAMARHEVDYLDLGGDSLPNDLLAKLKGVSGVRLIPTSVNGYLAVMYNVRPGRLLADPAIREAIERCIDRPALVDAATGGTGIALYSYVPPTSWAYLGPSGADVRDPAAARKVLEGDGWTMAADGIYEKGGRRLTFDILVRADADDRLKFVDLMAFQERDCGIEVKTHPAAFDALNAMRETYPHTVPGGKDPFDAYFGGWVIDIDPGIAPMFDSRQITKAVPPTDPAYQGWNSTGYANPKVDDLFDQGLATADQKQRARIYRELQGILGTDRPYLFGWAPVGTDAIWSDVRSLDGELRFDSRNWFWAPERIVVGG
jgi:ABC-type transport system substrate-binding protein